MSQQGPGYPAQPPKHAGEKGAERLREMADTATDRIKGVADQAQELAGDVSRQAREYGEKAQDAARQVKTVRRKVSQRTADDDIGSGGGDRIRAWRAVEEVAG